MYFKEYTRTGYIGDTVSPNNELFGDTVSPNNELFGDTVSPNNFFHFYFLIEILLISHRNAL